MKLTSENVEKVFLDCLFEDESSPEEREKSQIVVEGILNKYGFDLQKIGEHEDDISSMLKQLPKEFQEKTGGGWSFLNACNREDGEQWTGLHLNQEKLLTLGIAAGWAKIQLPRELWVAFPGGVPYFVVHENPKTCPPEGVRKEK